MQAQDAHGQLRPIFSPLRRRAFILVFVLGLSAGLPVVQHFGFGLETTTVVRWAKQSNVLRSAAEFLRECLRRSENESPFLHRIVESWPAESSSDYLGVRGWLCLDVVAGVAFWLAWRRDAIAVHGEVRKMQLNDRPDGSRYPEFIEYLVYSVGMFSTEGVERAEWLRDRFVADWEPEMGLFMAQWRYRYEALHMLPGLWQTRWNAQNMEVKGLSRPL